MKNIDYKVQLRRAVPTDSKIGPTVLYVVVQAPTSSAARNMAESMNHGYRALRVDVQR